MHALSPPAIHSPLPLVLSLQPTPGDIKFLTEQPMFFITGIWTSSLVKLYHYTAVLLGFRQWKGRGEDKPHAATATNCNRKLHRLI